MNYLLDTQAFLWIVTADERLSKRAKNIFLSIRNDFFLSIASIWEIAIKFSIGKLYISIPIQEFIHRGIENNDIKLLDIKFEHVLSVSSLPFHHRDSFDRLLITQAMSENFIILSNDKTFDKYSIKRVW